MKPFIFSFCIICIFSCNNTDKFRPPLQSSVDKLISETQLGHNDSTALAYLKDSCSKEELLRLINHKKAIIRILSYRALVNREDKNFFEILKNHLSDTAKLTWWYYDDVAGEFTISDLMIRKAERKLTKEQKDTLVKLVLLDHPYLDISNWMIQDIKPNPKYYTIIKSKATGKSDRCGIQMGANYALARFRKPEDIKILKENFIASAEVCSDWVFKAIETFPDTAFYPVLTAYFDNTIRKKKQSDADDLKYFCRAIAQYQNQTSLSILIALNKKTDIP